MKANLELTAAEAGFLIYVLSLEQSTSIVGGPNYVACGELMEKIKEMKKWL